MILIVVDKLSGEQDKWVKIPFKGV